MTALDTKALLEGVIAGPWSVNTTDEEIQVRSFHPSMICVMAYTDDIALKTAALIVAAPRLAREHTALSERVVVLEGERDGYMAALRWVYENGLPHDSKRPDFVNQAFSDAYAPNRAALNGEQTA